MPATSDEDVEQMDESMKQSKPELFCSATNSVVMDLITLPTPQNFPLTGQWCKFETKLVYRTSSRIAKVTQKNPASKNKKTKQQQQNLPLSLYFIVLHLSVFTVLI